MRGRGVVYELDEVEQLLPAWVSICTLPSGPPSYGIPSIPCHIKAQTQS